MKGEVMNTSLMNPSSRAAVKIHSNGTASIVLRTSVVAKAIRTILLTLSVIAVAYFAENTFNISSMWKTEAPALSCPVSEKVSAEQSAAQAAKLAEQKAIKEAEQNALVKYYSAQNKAVSGVAIKQIVRHTDEASKKFNVPQTLILAVIETESRLNPFAKSSGNAEGLMQIIPSYHQDKINANGGIENIVNPKYNILMGTAILREYLVKFNFNNEQALLQYNGSLADATKAYTIKVLGKKSAVDIYVAQALGTRKPVKTVSGNRS
jgi:soluble lytic murein transglycosylase-like protein